ncbi:MAG: SAM-dependent methyltransferase [Acidimicrobiales bacterium]
MTNTTRSYFEMLYSKQPDPWGFATEWYEQRKYTLTLASLPRNRYESAFEPGCSIGVLTEMLAPRCQGLLSFEMIPSALDQARQRLRAFPHVLLELAAIPDDWPENEFDLVVLSEIAYYFDKETLFEILERLLATTSIGATVIGVHWRGATDYPLSGDETHEIIDSVPGLNRVVQHREPLLALDVWERSK